MQTSTKKKHQQHKSLIISLQSLLTPWFSFQAFKITVYTVFNISHSKNTHTALKVDISWISFHANGISLQHQFSKCDQETLGVPGHFQVVHEHKTILILILMHDLPFSLLSHCSFFRGYITYDIATVWMQKQIWKSSCLLLSLTLNSTNVRQCHSSHYFFLSWNIYLFFIKYVFMLPYNGVYYF